MMLPKRPLGIGNVTITATGFGACRELDLPDAPPGGLHEGRPGVG